MLLCHLDQHAVSIPASTARYHLTSDLAFLPLGIAIEPFSQPDPTDLEHDSIVYGTSRYFSNLQLLERGFFKPAYYHASALLAASVAGLAGGVHGPLLRKRETKRERRDMRDGS